MMTVFNFLFFFYLVEYLSGRAILSFFLLLGHALQVHLSHSEPISEPWSVEQIYILSDKHFTLLFCSHGMNMFGCVQNLLFSLFLPTCTCLFLVILNAEKYMHPRLNSFACGGSSRGDKAMEDKARKGRKRRRPCPFSARCIFLHSFLIREYKL